MQVSVEKLDDFARRLKISVPGERYHQVVHARIRELSKTVSLNGFRQGKVPAMVIEKRYGQQIRDEVSNTLIRETLAEAVQQENLRPAQTPSVVKDAEGAEEFAYTATFEVLPEFPEIDVSDLVIEREVAQATDADIDRMIDTLRRQRMSFRPAERPAIAGDFVAFEFVISGDGVRIPEEGKERGLTAIGQKAVMPEIEDALVGMSAGEEKSITAAFPADYRDERIAGKTATIELSVTRINEGVLPEVDEQFALSFNISGGVDAFKREVRQNLERELGQALSGRLRGAVVEQLLKKYNDLAVPNSLVTSEAEAMQRQAVAEMTERAKQAGQPVPPPPAVESLRDIARRRVLAGLLLNEIATRNNLRLDDAKVRTALAAIASTYEDPSEVVTMYQQDQRLMNSLRARVMDEQVAEWVAQRAKVTEVERSFQEILQPGS
ncbi:MAG: trigger factor [Lysobacterales bacterium]|nr:trigger factor [Xanthomonadales bacterium]